MSKYKEQHQLEDYLKVNKNKREEKNNRRIKASIAF